MSEASAEGTITRTSTPRFTASPNASIGFRLWQGIGFWIQGLSRRADS